ncbi:hypothetical protein PGT21_028458 [Puccinia graminis f. sp. tritici]|uniref:Uncharacterized protein n=1 Tax=Puccinia graminis f. sp. tritici TaxID=56615 RepID=A0A5B0QJN4_PUCGR|nr:hypothetical protein PGT21_028458 [Puccinia graminis f. sp. tritici]
MCKEKQRISGSESAQATIIIYNNPVGISVTRRIIFFPHPAKRPTWGFSRCKAQVMNLVGIFLTSHRGNSCWLDTAHPTSGPRRRSSRGKLADVMSTEEVKPMTLPCVRPAWRACQRAPTTPGPRDRSGGQPDPTPPAFDDKPRWLGTCGVSVALGHPWLPAVPNKRQTAPRRPASARPPPQRPTADPTATAAIRYPHLQVATLQRFLAVPWGSEAQLRPDPSQRLDGKATQVTKVAHAPEPAIIIYGCPWPCIWHSTPLVFFQLSRAIACNFNQVINLKNTQHNYITSTGHSNTQHGVYRKYRPGRPCCPSCIPPSSQAFV